MYSSSRGGEEDKLCTHPTRERHTQLPEREGEREREREREREERERREEREERESARAVTDCHTHR